MILVKPLSGLAAMAEPIATPITKLMINDTATIRIVQGSASAITAVMVVPGLVIGRPRSPCRMLSR